MRAPDRYNEELHRFEWLEVHRPSGEELVVGWIAAEIYDWAVEQDLVDDHVNPR